MPASFTLEFDDFDAMRRLIRDHCGIWLNDGKQSFLQARLAERLQVWNISSAQEYYYFVKYDAHGPEEMQQLIDAITVNETWFFRETGPIEAWREAVLPQLLKRSEPVRVWSAGCATGEEAYTVAILLLEACADSSRFEILATDISQRALKTAREAKYDPYSLRHTDPARQARYFEPLPDGRRMVRPDVQSLVRFGYANLADPTLAQRVQKMDAILCRNVIIYLDERSRQVAINTLHAALKPGGYLLLGHSESLIHTSTPFEVARLAGKITYRKSDKT